MELEATGVDGLPVAEDIPTLEALNSSRTYPENTIITTVEAANEFLDTRLAELNTTRDDDIPSFQKVV
jgi:hypothetical protein